MFDLCLNRYSCRVVQTAIEVGFSQVLSSFYFRLKLPHSQLVITKISLQFFDDDLKQPLLEPLRDVDLVILTVDQNANHVIQKVSFCSFRSYSNFRFIRYSNDSILDHQLVRDVAVDVHSAVLPP